MSIFFGNINFVMKLYDSEQLMSRGFTGSETNTSLLQVVRVLLLVWFDFLPLDVDALVYAIILVFIVLSILLVLVIKLLLLILLVVVNL